MVRKSAPASSRCVAKQCLKVCEAAGRPEHFKVYQPESNHVYTEQYFEWVVDWAQEVLLKRGPTDG